MDEIKENKFKNVPKSVISFLERALEEIQNKRLNEESSRMIDLALVNLKYHPMAPMNDISISFDLFPITYYIFYGLYKIDISADVSENDGHGYDHYRQFSLKYEADGYVEEVGDLEEFKNEFFSMIESVPIEKICISGEE